MDVMRRILPEESGPFETMKLYRNSQFLWGIRDKYKMIKQDVVRFREYPEGCDLLCATRHLTDARKEFQCSGRISQ